MVDERAYDPSIKDDLIKYKDFMYVKLLSFVVFSGYAMLSLVIRGGKISQSWSVLPHADATVKFYSVGELTLQAECLCTSTRFQPLFLTCRKDIFDLIPPGQTDEMRSLVNITTQQGHWTVVRLCTVCCPFTVT